VVEGDSQIIINILQRILNGANLDKVTPSWRLSHGIQLLQANNTNTGNHPFPCSKAGKPSCRRARQHRNHLDGIGSPMHLCAGTGASYSSTMHSQGSYSRLPPDGVVLRATWQRAGRRGRPAEHGAMCSARAPRSHHPGLLMRIQADGRSINPPPSTTSMYSTMQTSLGILACGVVSTLALRFSWFFG
jgi:hypothetical protein